MKLGMCASPDNLEKVVAYGFDYIEIGVTTVGDLSEEDFAKVKARFDAAPINCEAANVMLPGPRFHVTGPNANHDFIVNYLETAFARLAALGCKSVVLGSGGARRIPEGFDEKEAHWQMVMACRKIADVAAKNDITIVLEPLNRGETNIVNSVEEGAWLVDEVAHPNFKLLADIYHMALENEPYENLIKYQKDLRHIHLSHPTNRNICKENDGGEYDYFFDVVKKANYDGRISIECRIENFEEEVPVAEKYVRSFM